MRQESPRRVLATLLAGAALFVAGGACAQDHLARRTQADCDRIRVEYQQADRKEKEQLDMETAALAEAQKAADTADKIRGMKEWERATTQAKAEAELAKLRARRIEEHRGQAFSELDPWIVKLEVFVSALKDAKMRAEEASNSGGLLNSDRNALDGFAKQLRARAAKAKEQAADWARRSEAGRRAYQDCLAELERKRGALEDDDAGEQWASAAGDDDYDDYGGGYGGYDDSIGSDAYPPRPSVRPPRVRPARSDRWSDRWSAPAGYDGPDDMRPDRRARRDGWREDARRGDRVRDDGRRGDRMRAGGAQRDDRRGGRKGKGGKGGKGSHCHTNPITGQEHCGSG